MNGDPRRFDPIPEDPENAPDDPRPLADWVRAMGPEGENPERIIDNLEEFAYDAMDDGSFPGDDVDPQGAAVWTEATYDDEFSHIEEVGEAYGEKNIDGDWQSERSVEDQAIQDLDEDDT